MKIFFGSSNNYKSIVQKIANEIEDDRIKISGWWENKLFPVGATTIESIERVPTRVDAALLFLTSDDELIQRGMHSMAARDNVIFEAGFLMSTFGRSRTAVARVGDVNIPTDLLGLTYLALQPGDSDQAVEENVRRVRKWCLTLIPSCASEELCSIASRALDRASLVGRNTIQLTPPELDKPALTFPLTAYPFFLNELLKQVGFKAVAVETVGNAQIASFRAVQEYASLGLRPFDHRSSHWYLWTYCPPEPEALDDDKMRILRLTAANPSMRRYVCLEQPEHLPKLLFHSLYSYAKAFLKLKPQARLYFVVDQISANTPNWMYLSIRDTWFRAERKVDDVGTSIVEIIQVEDEPADPFEGHRVLDAVSFTGKYQHLDGGGL